MEARIPFRIRHGSPARGTARALCLWWGLICLSWGHPHQVSVGTAEWIAETQSFEVALKVSVDDLEEVLSTLAQREVSLGDESEFADKALKNYVGAKFTVRGPGNEVIHPTWIGYEVEEADAWIYLAIAIGQESLKGFKIRHEILIDAYEEQVNLLNVKRGDRRKTLKFRHRQREQDLPRLP